tara:strand:+ start:385 stop:675 length:291 start_codon:yes stop_codon:yes gene_type:complete
MTTSLKNKIIATLEDIKAVNPVAINVKKISSLTDFMVIASGTSDRHINAMSERVNREIKERCIRHEDRRTKRGRLVTGRCGGCNRSLDVLRCQRIL